MISISSHPLLFIKTSFQHVPGLHWHIHTLLDSTDFTVKSQILLAEH